MSKQGSNCENDWSEVRTFYSHLLVIFFGLNIDTPFPDTRQFLT